MVLLAPFVANATPLETAVADYNARAALLTGKLSDFNTIQSTALAQYNVVIDAWLDYLGSSNPANDDSLYHIWLDEVADLEVLSTSVQTAFDVYVQQLDSTCEALDEVLAADLADATSVAFATGSSHFGFSSTPFMFYRSSGNSQLFLSFTFPIISTGSALSHTSYTPASFPDFWVFVRDLWDWIDFGIWAAEHGDDGAQMNQNREDDLTLLCIVCLERTYTAESQLNARGYTTEDIDNFCESEEGWEYMCNSDGTPNGKAADVRRFFPDKYTEDLGFTVDAVEDHVIPSWWEYIGLL